MTTKITRDILEAYLFCKFKGYLKYTRQHGIRSDYGALLIESRAKVKIESSEQIIAKFQQDQIARDIALTTDALKCGPSIILGATLENDLLCLSFDGLKKVPGPSKLGDFHYIPMLFYEGRQIRKEARLLLGLYGALLFKLQGTIPSRGIIWHGEECKPSTVTLNIDLRKSEQFLGDLKDLLNAGSPPKLALNDHCQICEFRQRCQDQAVREDNMSLLRGMSEKEIKKYNKKGIFTITQLAHTFRPRRQGKKPPKTTSQHYPALQALAVRDKRIYVLRTPELPESTVRIYFDIESNPEADFVYLIGMVIVKDGSEVCHTYWADQKSQEHKIFERFITEVTRHDDFRIYCYGAYELAYLKRMRKAAKKKKLVDKVISASVNILSLIYSQVYFPTFSNGLKNIGTYLGCSWAEPESSGLQSVVWRVKWETTHGEEWKQMLITYNLEDCSALRRVADEIKTIIAESCTKRPELTAGADQSAITFVKDVEKLAFYHKWGNVNFVHSDYEYVNKRAYFDYQRERVYVRNSKASRKSKARGTQSLNRSLRVSEQKMIVASRCPSCKSRKVISGIKNQVQTRDPRVKKAYDLLLTPSSIRRRVIAFRTSLHQCQICGEEFIPEQYQRLDRHFHGLKSWTMFQHIEYRTSLSMIRQMVEELFDIRIHSTEIYMFKSLMAQFYKPTYHKILKRMLSGNLLHADETEVRLKSGKGYVWTFTNLEEVIFMFKPTREGGFLHDLLKGFQGVLVSDFYAAYDSIKCQQQKCLVHLMRDVNQELLNNPFDEELKLITRPFGSLLRGIITTIDKHGLKRKYLMKHDREVTSYFGAISAFSFRSEAAAALQARLMRYHNKLFTFINHDGVPWNNNNAEHAIKQFAYYREVANGLVTETGLNDYLLLLSICQTCKYKGVSFLKFLLSRERDVDAYWVRPHRRRRPQFTELYPKGFIPSHMAFRSKK